MPDWLLKNIPALITLVVISAGGIASFARMEAKIQTLEDRVTRLEASQDNMLTLLNKVDRKLALLLCKTDPNFCLER